MGLRTKVQHALKYFPALFDTEKYEESHFQLERCDSPAPAQVRSAIISSLSITTT